MTEKMWFRWSCLGVAVVFVASALWMLDDIRRQVRASSERLPEAVDNIRESAEISSRYLPQIVARVDTTTKQVETNLPDIIERINKATEVVGELAEDIRQLKELAGVSNTKRDDNIVAYANALLTAVENSGGRVGNKKLVMGSGLKNDLPAKEWAAGARKEALFLTLVVKSKQELLKRLTHTKLGFGWYIETPGKAAVKLEDWLADKG